MDSRYAAGFFDADGCVGVRQNVTKHWVVQVSVANCHPGVLKGFKREFGGSIHSQGRIEDRHRRLYQWMTASKNAQLFLLSIRPHVVVKKEQVRLALEFQASVDKWRYKLGNQYKQHPQRDAVMAYRASLAEKIRLLKHERFDL